MPHPLQQRLAALRTRVRWLVLAYGFFWAVTAAVAAVVVLGLIDYLIRFQDVGLRVICSLAALGAVGWSIYRFLYLPLVHKLGDAELALRVQRRFPWLGDRLVSAVEFLGQSEDDPLAGSAALRKTVIAEADAQSDQLDFVQAVDPRPSLRAGMAGAIVCLLAAVLIVLDPLSARTALARLVNPFGSTAWPQKTHLALRERVTRVARGGAFAVEVFDAQGARLPDDLRIDYRLETPDGRVTEESQRLTEAAGAAVARRENVQRPFSYRVEGGDDRSMPWIAVDVVDPPEIDTLSIRLSPPPYTGWPAHAAEKHIRALVGTAVAMQGKTTKALRSAALCFEGGRRVPAQLSPDGFRFTVPPEDAEASEPIRKGVRPPRFKGSDPFSDRLLVIERSGAYWFELVDREGIANAQPSRWEILAVTDAPPDVDIEEPDETLFVTARAEVPLTVVVRDDLAVWRADLVVRPAGVAEEDAAAETLTLPLWVGPDKAPAASETALGAGELSGDRRVLRRRWPLAELGLTPGDQLLFHATASDYLPQTSESQPRRLAIITPEELQDRIAARQARIMTELTRVLDMQRESRAQTAALEIRLGEIRQLDQVDLDRLQAAELGQRRASRALADPDEGVPKQVRALLADLESNRVDSPDVKRHMEGLLEEIDRLEREHLTPIGRELTAAIKAARVAVDEGTAPTPPGPRSLSEKGSDPLNREGLTPFRIGSKPLEPVTTPLAEGGKHQDAVIASLERLLGDLAQWDNYRRFHREVSELLRGQEEILEETTELGRRTLGRELRDLTPQERADLKVLARGQLELGRQFDRIQEEMGRAAEQLASTQPLAAEIVADALAEARRLGLSAEMRSAGGQVGENRIGGAVATQKQIVEDLKSVLDVLANRREHELERLVKKLQEAEADLDGLHRRQAAARAAADRAAAGPDDAARREMLKRLAQEEQQLRDETERMTRRLERLMARRAAESCSRAAGQMGTAGECAGGGRAAEAADAAARAQASLEDAQDELARRRFQAQAELALEQLAQLQDALEHLRRQQDGALVDTRHYAALAAGGPLTPGQLAGLRDLARLQRSLQLDTERLGEEIRGVRAFQLALGRAARSMGRAAGLLERRQTDAPTTDAQEQALARLDMVLEALKPEPPDEGNGGPSGGAGAGAGGPQGGVPAGVQHVAELKLLKLLQQELNLRTRELDRAVEAAGALTPEQQLEFARLRDDQQRLLELVLELLPVEGAGPEDGNGTDENGTWFDLPERREGCFAQIKPGPIFVAARAQPPSTLDEELLEGLGSDPLDPVDRQSAEPGAPRGEDGEASGRDDEEWQERLRRELGDAAEKESDNPLLEIARKMRDAQGRLDRHDAGSTTQIVQKQIVDDLEKLIDEARKAAKQSAGGQSRAQAVAARKPVGQPPAGGQPQGGQPSDRPAAESTQRPRTASGRPREVDLEQVRAIIKELWGELPEREREQMLESPPTEFLPKYELLIEGYFRRLAEEKTP